MQEFLSDTVSIQQQPGLQMDERDEAAAPAEQVSLFFCSSLIVILWKCIDCKQAALPCGAATEAEG